MRLEARDDEPGLWVNPHWQEGTPGAFAVVIGVSAYAHLEGGETPADETYGLGQLQVSALTAYRFFRWLADDYRVDGCPLAKCWLLLSPTARERQHTPELADHLTPPTFANCEQALRYWRHHMAQLPATAADTSRALFFFSGHGLEVHQEQQVLLPSDYLPPPAPNWNDAISTDNLTKGLASLAAPHQLFFLDACRNDHHALRAKRITGADIFNEDESAQVNPRLVAPVLYATASGQQAFQQPTPERGLSLFGQALLDGLAGRPDIALQPVENNLYAVNLYPLQGYMKARVMELLQEANAQVIQPIKLGGGNIDNAPLTHLERAALLPRSFHSLLLKLVGGGRLEAVRLNASRVERSLVDRFASRAVGHDAFGSEDATALWRQHARLYALGQRRWLAPDDLDLHDVERNAAQDAYRVTLSAARDDPVGYWLQIDDPEGTSHACILPAEPGAAPRYALEFDLQSNARGRRYLSRLEGFLADDNPGVLRQAAALWQRYRVSDVGEAANAFAASGLTQMAQGRLDSPLAAAVAALVLLRANRLDALRPWVRNLANEYASWPDGSALWATQQMRQGASAEAANDLANLWRRGLPHTSETLGYTARWVRVLQPSSAPLGQLNERLQDALIYFRPGGFLTAYAGFPPDLEPTTLVGPFES